MGPPSWIYDLFAIAMLLVAAYAAGLLVLSFRPGEDPGRDVDVSHLLMGVAMAGMFEPKWAFWPNWFWEAAFFALLVWFLVRSAQSIQRFGVHVPHEAIHAAMSLAMLFMYWYPMASSSGSTSMSMSMSSSSHAMLDPGIGLVLIMAFLGSAIFTLGSPVKGLSHHGSHLSSRALVAVGASTPVGALGDAEGPVAEVNAILMRPWLLDLSHVVMCIGMGFMLVLML